MSISMSCVTCVNKVCDKDTGNCIVCPEGKYNQKCEQPCPYTCGNNSCEQKSGKCTDCNVGKYGPTCANCSVKCSAAKCDFDGQCTDGCVDGRYGDRCELPCLGNCTSCTRDGEQCLGCIDGMFGSFCSRECGQCVGQRCNIDTGHCETPCQMGWTGQRCEVKAEKQTEDDSSNVGTYVGVGGVSIFVVMIVIIAVVCIIKRKSSTSGETASSPSVAYGGPNPSNNSNRHSDETGGHVYLNLQDGSMPEQSENPENVYYNEGPVGFPVSMLKTLISEKMEDEEKKFISEFEAFPVGAIHPHAIAEKNKSKNRFKAIYPYDHSRVILNTIPGGNSSDYINANYIDSVEERKVYVATQGPLPSTTDDFWRMVWTINSGKIVMLTNLVESRKDKCEKYWPDEGDSMTTKTFDIMLNRERDYASHVVRNITVIDRKSKEKRDIHQFHFTTWPDHGTPNTLELVLFHRRVKLHKTTLPGQMVVHCSAGIGRTGTFIALDALLDFGKKYDRINIRHYVNMMRKDRMHMIQTEVRNQIRIFFLNKVRAVL
ncbi:receptor-type tyrosine-protein phosphatase S-like [Pecten maximus]|uniref:receptor-type tyrosine-protein phosphatase S-like n=1 Tax=Pecten maximus TaxID=6579 RepID=UPI00145861D6|nr:receptor-type tyrosine-protein phosphatase S-like [Pecten maximus]